MPLHRAFYRTSEAALAAGSATVARLTAKDAARALAAGADASSASPVVGVRVMAVENTNAPGLCEALMRITSPDGRSSDARAVMSTAQTDTLLSKASGFVTVTLFTYAMANAVARRAQAASVVTTAGVTLTYADRLSDPSTGKVYEVNSGGYIIPSAGTWVVPVREVDSLDTADVSYGTTLRFTSPPAAVSPFATVCSMEPISVSVGAIFLDAKGRRYLAAYNATASETVYSFGGNLVREFGVYRDPTDGLDATTSLEVDDVLTLQGTVGTYSQSVSVVTKNEATIPEGHALTRAGKAYETSAPVTISDTGTASVAFRATEYGSASDIRLDLGPATMTILSPPANVTASADVTTAVAAGTYPEPYTAQIIGAPLSWSSSVTKAPDGRWLVEVYTLPRGS